MAPDRSRTGNPAVDAPPVRNRTRGRGRLLPDRAAGGPGPRVHPLAPAVPEHGARARRGDHPEHDSATTGPDAMIIRLFTASGDFQRSMYPAPIMIRFP
ncbi:hypothetical protein ATKI12_8915 [Kitasatospora sp. Ki12]